MALPVVKRYPLFHSSKFHFTTKEPKFDKDECVADRFARMQENYNREGMKTTVEGVLLVHRDRHPSLLLMQMGNYYKLPGGRLKPEENEIEGLRRKLTSKLADDSTEHQPDWQIGECVAVWWRPNFDHKLYPYCAPDIREPKECKKLFIVHLSEGMHIAVPENFELIAVPLCEIYNNRSKYQAVISARDSNVISAIPEQLSRFRFDLISHI